MALDQTALNELRALDPDGSSGLLTRIIASYLKDAPNLIQQMRTALAGNDIVSMTRHAHTLKSTSLSLGATRVGQMARELEFAGKDKAIESCRNLLVALTAEYAVAEHLLRVELAAAQRPK